MFQNIVPLNFDTHRHLRFDARQNYGFASELMLSPVVSAEAGHIAREYVMAFSSQSESLPLALLGVEKGRNAYVNEQGDWDARYIPAHVRRYPFMLAESAGDKPAGPENRAFTIMVDTAAPHFSATAGGPLFDDKGAPTEVLQRVQEALSNLQHGQLRTLKQVAQLEAAGLLEDQVLRVQRAGKEAVDMRGLRIINRQKFSDLSAETLHELHLSGALALAHAHFISLSNLTDGPLMGKPSVKDLPQIFQDGNINFGGLH